MARCVVSYLDSEGLRHSVEVEAESLFEAAVFALKTKQHDCAPGELTKLEVEIRSSVVHETTGEQSPPNGSAVELGVRKRR